MTFQNKGRLAGFIYLIVVLTGIYNLIYVPTQLIEFSDAATTVNNIMSSELLFRSGIAAGVISYVAFLILPFVLFDIFKDVNRPQATLMVILAAISVPISIYSLVDKVNVLTMLSDAPYLAHLNAEQIQSQVMVLLRSYYNGIMVVQIFWGLWLFPFGYLVFKSGYIPRILGVCLMLGCFGYLARFFVNIVFPELTVPSFVKLPGSIGEIGTCLWLLIMGVKAPIGNGPDKA